MGLLLQIVVFLVIAAALGFAVGWLVRGTRPERANDGGATEGQARISLLEGERDRLQAELAAAEGGPGTGPTAGVEVERRAAAAQAGLQARITHLERELADARQAHATQQAEIGRLEARLAEQQAGAAQAPSLGPVAQPMVAEAVGRPPPALARPEGQPDDLQLISGIGPGIERTLHGLGIFHFRQIAAFTPDQVAWVNQHLRFKGRIEREDWIGQARKLAAAAERL